MAGAVYTRFPDRVNLQWVWSAMHRTNWPSGARVWGALPETKVASTLSTTSGSISTYWMVVLPLTLTLWARRWGLEQLTVKTPPTATDSKKNRGLARALGRVVRCTVTVASGGTGVEALTTSTPVACDGSLTAPNLARSPAKEPGKATLRSPVRPVGCSP